MGIYQPWYTYQVTMGGESTSSSNPEKGRTSKRKKKIQNIWKMHRPEIKNA